MQVEAEINRPFVPVFITRFFQRYPVVLVIIALTLLWALFFWRFLTPNDADRQIIPEGDFTVQFYANADYQVERIHNGEIPLWNPYNYAGEPFFANWQLGAWYPPRWIAGVLWGSSDGWTLEAFMREVMAHYWLTSVFTYVFLFVLTRKYLPAIAGSLIFTYGGYLTSYPMQQLAILEGATWLPLTLLGVHLSITQPRWRLRGIALSALAVALAVLAGHPQTIMQVGYMTLFYLIFLAWQHKLNLLALLWRIVLLGLLGVGLAMIQLLPSLEFTLLSARLENFTYADKSAGLSVSSLPQMLFPTLFGLWSPLYVGIVALLLTITAFLKPTAKHAFWIGVIVVCILLGLGRESILYDLFYVIVPGGNLFRQQERIVLLIAFSVAVLSAYQLAELTLNDALKQTRRLSIAFLGFTALMLSAVLVVGMVNETPINNTADVIGFTVLIALLLVEGLHWAGTQRQSTVAIILISIIVLDLFSINTRSANHVPDDPTNRSFLPSSVQDYCITDDDVQWRVDGATGVRGYGTLYRIPDMYGVAPVFLESMDELRRLPVDRFWEIFAVRYITAVEEPPEFVPLELLAYDVNSIGEEFRVFELQDPRPMAHLVYDYSHGEGSPEFARLIMADSQVNLRDMAITTDPLDFELSGARPDDASVTDFQWESPEAVSMTVTTSENALLTISIPNYPGWQATINGERVDIVDVYVGLIGIPISPGDNQLVRLEFVPASVIFGAVISGVALLISIGLCVLEVMRKRAKAHHPA